LQPLQSGGRFGVEFFLTGLGVAQIKQRLPFRKFTAVNFPQQLADRFMQSLRKIKKKQPKRAAL
jgi:hypothetical protein